MPKKQNKQKKRKPLFPSSLKSGLYVVTCVPLQKHYVGWSTNVVPRLNAHKSMLRRNCHDNSKMQKDYNIYGSASFIYQRFLMGIGCTKPQLEWLEVQVLSTLPEEKRYNVYVDWHKRDPELNPFYGRRHTSETRAALSETRKGVASGFKGHLQSNAVRELISQQNSGQSSQERRKPVYIDEVYYESVSQAHELTGYARRITRERCNSSEERYNHFRWYPK